MRTSGRFNYAELHPDCQIVELPVRTPSHISIFIILPYDIFEGFESLEKKFSGEYLYKSVNSSLSMMDLEVKYST